MRERQRQRERQRERERETERERDRQIFIRVCSISMIAGMYYLGICKGVK